MKMAIRLFVLLSVAACTLAQRQSNRPAYIDCLSDNDCDPGQCCSIGQNRYSIPQCRPLQGEGNVCRPGNPLLVSGPFYYPNGLVLQLDNVHLNLCPCAEGLVCDRVNGQCSYA